MRDQHIEDRLRDLYQPLRDVTAPRALRASVRAISERRPAVLWRDRFRMRPVLGFAALLLSATLAVGGLLVFFGSPAPAPVQASPSPTSPAASTTPAPSTPASGLPGNGLIAYSSKGQIYVVRPDGTGRRLISEGGSFDYMPAWSPDDATIALLSQHCDATPVCPDKITPTSLIVMNADGTGRRTVATNLENVFTLAWNPDGRRILFDAYRPGGVVVAFLDGSPLLKIANGQFATWSPDGKTIALIGEDESGGPNGIHLVASDGTGERLLVGSTSKGTPEGRPLWSPDGSRLAFVRHGCCPPTWSGGYVVDPVGGKTGLLTGLPDGASFLGWSPDGRSMAYLVTSGTGTSATRHIVLADVDGSNTRTLAASWAFLGWSPDATVLLEAAGPGAPSDPFPNGLLIVDPTGARSPVQISAEDLFGQSWQAIR